MKRKREDNGGRRVPYKQPPPPAENQQPQTVVQPVPPGNGSKPLRPPHKVLLLNFLKPCALQNSSKHSIFDEFNKYAEVGQIVEVKPEKTVYAPPSIVVDFKKGNNDPDTIANLCSAELKAKYDVDVEVRGPETKFWTLNTLTHSDAQQYNHGPRNMNYAQNTSASRVEPKVPVVNTQYNPNQGYNPTSQKYSQRSESVIPGKPDEVQDNKTEEEGVKGEFVNVKRFIPENPNQDKLKKAVIKVGKKHIDRAYKNKKISKVQAKEIMRKLVNKTMKHILARDDWESNMDDVIDEESTSIKTLARKYIGTYTKRARANEANTVDTAE